MSAVRTVRALLLGGMLLGLPAAAWTQIVPAPPDGQVDVFGRGEGEYHTYRIPAVTVTTSGTVLAFCEGRRNSGADHGDIDLLVKRSGDGGLTWSGAAVVHGEPGEVTIGNPVPVVDASTGIVWLVFCRNNRRVFVTKSSDDGRTWDAPREITRDVRLPGYGLWYATGPGHGIQMSSGTLVIPCNHAIGVLPGEPPRAKQGTSSHAVISDDHGATWRVGGPVGEKTNEATVAEGEDGTLIVNARSYAGKHRRAVARSRDGGATWSPVELDPALVEPICQASLLAATDGQGRRVLLFSNPASEKRERMTVRLSEDDGRTWPGERVLYEGRAAYSDLCALGDGMYGCLYERDRYDRITFARFRLADLRATTDN